MRRELIDEAKNPNTNASRLWAMYMQYQSLGHEIAKNPNTPPELLERLALQSDFSVDEALVQNPNTPFSILLLLGERFPQHFLENPVFSLLLLESPNLAKELPVSTLCQLLALAQVPEVFLSYAAEHKETRVRLAVATNPSPPARLLITLATDYEPQIRLAVATHLLAPGEALDYLATDEETRVREAVAKHPDTPPATLEILAGDIEKTVRFETTQNASTPGESLSLLYRAGSSRDLSRYALPDPTLGEKEFAILAKGGDWARELVARNPNTPSSLLEILAKDSRTNVRQALAQNPATPPYILTRLSEDLDADTRFFVARNPNVFQTLLLRLAQEERIRWEIASNPNTPSHILVHLWHSSDELTREMIAQNKATPNGTRKTLAEDSSPRVRAAVARCSFTSLTLLKKLSNDTHMAVQNAARENYKRGFTT